MADWRNPTYEYRMTLQANPDRRRCEIEGCDSPHQAKRMCSAHYVFSWKYNLTFEQVQKAAQIKICPICLRESKLVMDHDHRCCDEQSRSCGECLRGMICSTCNRGLGYLLDEVDVLLRAVSYLSGEYNLGS